MQTLEHIPVAAPVLGGNEKSYVLDCLEEGWISSNGKYITRFEEGFATYCGARHGIACCNGTVALHLALLALGIGPGDEVIVPTLTFVATANSVTYCGATPVFADSDPQTWTISPTDVERKITPRTKAIIAVHLYGHPADMDALLAIADKHGLKVIEDAAEAHGAEYRGRRTGNLAHVSTFSFYGNKVITTGEGGMVLTDDTEMAAKLRSLRGQGMDPQRRYWFPIIGYNYRLTNIAAAIGLAQLERIGWQLERRREVAGWYQELLGQIPRVSWQAEASWARHAQWMFTLILPPEIDRDWFMAQLADQGIETRPVFYPNHVLPPYQPAAGSENLPVAQDLAARGLNLPTWAGLTRSHVERICRCVSEILAVSHQSVPAQ